MPELLLDPAIRTWVFVPIVVITFFIGILRHYISMLLTSPKKPAAPGTPGTLTPLQTLKDSQALMRARLLRENGRFLPRQAYLMRKTLFNDPERGLLVVAQKREAAPAQSMMNPDMMSEMMKGNITNVLPMIAVGGWINYTFSGFVTTKVPFPLTQKFKIMMQRGIFLQSLDPSWVSSASWYFICVFGLRQIYQLVLGADNAADSSARMMQDQMSGGAAGMPQDSRALFKAEWEAMELHEHVFELRGVDEELAAVAALQQQPAAIAESAAPSSSLSSSNNSKAALMQKKIHG